MTSRTHDAYDIREMCEIGIETIERLREEDLNQAIEERTQKMRAARKRWYRTLFKPYAEPTREEVIESLKKDDRSYYFGTYSIIMSQFSSDYNLLNKIKRHCDAITAYDTKISISTDDYTVIEKWYSTRGQ